MKQEKNETVKIQDILEQFNITLDEYRNIVDKFYQHKLQETDLGDKTFTCIAIELLSTFGIIQANYITMFTDIQKVRRMDTNFFTLSSVIVALIDIVRTPVIKNGDIVGVVENIREWLKCAIGVMRRMNVPFTDVQIVYRLTDPIYALLDILAEINGSDYATTSSTQIMQ